MSAEPSSHEIEARVRHAASRGLLAVGHVVLELAKPDIPKGDPAVDPDPSVTLAESGRVEVEHGGRSIIVSFDTPYAAKQEKNLRLKHPRGGEAHFLEGALLRVIPKVEELVASEIRKGL